jgi:RNA polymerase sigma factor (sigma-70 family)
VVRALNRSGDLESTASLLAKVRRGDSTACDRLLVRYVPIFQRWARGRVPDRCRPLTNTDDLVQDTLVRVLKHLKDFEPQHEGAFLAYLRKTLLNLVHDKIRQVERRPPPGPLEDLPDKGRNPLDITIDHETFEAYEAALAKLTDLQREAFILRMELGFSYPEIAEAMNLPSPDAARRHVSRALLRLAECMRDHKKGR